MEMPLKLTQVTRGIHEVYAEARGGAYHQLVETITERSREGQERGQDRGHVRDVLAVQFGLDATLRAFSKASNSLPSEIHLRSSVAASCAERIAKVGVREGLFIEVYAPHDELVDLMTAAEFQRLNSAMYLGRLIRAVFTDAEPVVGGAHRVLERRKDILEKPSDIIKRSTSLLVISGISRERHKKTWTQLGYPYILPRHFAIDTKSESEVKFNDQARALIAAGSKGAVGCPAAKVADCGGPGTVLTRSWERLVDYLLGDGATSKFTNTKFNI